ncbi:MAG: DegV family protein [Butyrivibrio sp.]
MSRVAVVTDSNSGITIKEGEERGIYVLPMPFYINEELFFEGIDLTQEQFYEKLKDDSIDIKTSMPTMGDVVDLWDKVLKEYDELVYIPMSSGLSSSCETAIMLSQDYDGKVQVVNNQRISVTQKLSVFDARQLADEGKSAAEIKEYLEDTKFDSTIYIAMGTLKYLKKGGRITPAAAALGTLLKIKPVLQILGEKLDAFAKARTTKQAKQIMIDSIQKDIENKLHCTPEECHISMAYTDCIEDGLEFKKEVQEIFPDHDIIMDPLPLSVACHIGPGAIAVTVTKKMK